ncbi:hypothetical protein V6N11_082701 [Hibiscus sabdariffa]|uniref:Uncharacterized protein n=1 Tax=Hibiscus sabdariffa TaxID=183260 RepID=A0ABR2A9B2_9ROSI
MRDSAHGKFAHLAIVIDLNQLLISCIKIDCKLQKLNYEGLYNICYDYDVYGHSKDIFRKTKGTEKEQIGEVVECHVSEALIETNLYGPWIIVDNCLRTWYGTAREETLRASKKNPNSGSRFDVLVTDKKQEEQRDVDWVDVDVGT